MLIAEEQHRSAVSQAFVFKGLKVDPSGLTFEVKGTLNTLVGAM